MILIRAGYRRKAVFSSEVLQAKAGILPVYLDLLDLFLSEAERCGMDFFFGTYDSGAYWLAGNHQAESDINRALCEQVVAKYGHRRAFKGWYISHETMPSNGGVMRVYQ